MVKLVQIVSITDSNLNQNGLCYASASDFFIIEIKFNKSFFSNSAKFVLNSYLFIKQIEGLG